MLKGRVVVSQFLNIVLQTSAVYSTSNPVKSRSGGTVFLCLVCLVPFFVSRAFVFSVVVCFRVFYPAVDWVPAIVCSRLTLNEWCQSFQMDPRTLQPPSVAGGLFFSFCLKQVWLGPSPAEGEGNVGRFLWPRGKVSTYLVLFSTKHVYPPCEHRRNACCVHKIVKRS